MRFTSFLLLCAFLFLACKTTRAQRSTELSLDNLDNEEQLPACDDITVGRVYWVRSLNQQMHCVEGGTWQPREIDTESKEQPGAGPRAIH